MPFFRPRTRSTYRRSESTDMDPMSSEQEEQQSPAVQQQESLASAKPTPVTHVLTTMATSSISKERQVSGTRNQIPTTSTNKSIPSSRTRVLCPEGCGQFVLKSRLPLHIRKHRGDKLFPCPYDKCQMSFYQAYDLNRHITRIHLKTKDLPKTFSPQRCKYCNKMFNTLSAWRRHMIHQHPQEYSMEKLQRISTMVRKCPTKECNLCGKTITVGTMSLHMKRHRGERSFHCPHKECGKSFYQPKELAHHVKTHTKPRIVKPFQCKQCEVSYSRKDYLARHMKTKHIDVCVVQKFLNTINVPEPGCEIESEGSEGLSNIHNGTATELKIEPNIPKTRRCHIEGCPCNSDRCFLFFVRRKKEVMDAFNERITQFFGTTIPHMKLQICMCHFDSKDLPYSYKTGKMSLNPDALPQPPVEPPVHSSEDLNEDSLRKILAEREAQLRDIRTRFELYRTGKMNALEERIFEADMAGLKDSEKDSNSSLPKQKDRINWCDINECECNNAICNLFYRKNADSDPFAAWVDALKTSFGQEHSKRHIQLCQCHFDAVDFQLHKKDNKLVLVRGAIPKAGSLGPARAEKRSSSERMDPLFNTRVLMTENPERGRAKLSEKLNEITNKYTKLLAAVNKICSPGQRILLGLGDDKPKIPKKEARRLTLAEKYQVIKMFDEGVNRADIQQKYDITAGVLNKIITNQRKQVIKAFESGAVDKSIIRISEKDKNKIQHIGNGETQSTPSTSASGKDVEMIDCDLDEETGGNQLLPMHFK